MSESVSRIRLATAQDWHPYRAPWWLPGGHVQTVWRKLAPVPVLRRGGQRLELADGDFIDLDWYPADRAEAARRPLVVALHGLCGCSSSPYILALQHHLHGRGYDSVAMNLRGCGTEPNRLARSYHSGCSDDLEEVVRALPEGRPLVLVGYSLGANVMIKWLAETSRHDRVQAAVAVSTPFSLARCCDAMINGRVSRFYGHYFLRQLLRAMERKKQWLAWSGRHAALAELDALADPGTLRNIREFDDRVTAPLHGFASASDYYRRCSSGAFLYRVKTPTLIIHSHNDPLIPPASLPDAARLPDNIIWDVHERGGHVGFAVSGRRFWLEQRVVDFMELT